MEMTDTVFDAANRRGEDMKATFPAAVAVRYDRRISRVVISLASGLQIAFAPRDAQGLENAHPADLVDAEISPSGLGVHFPKLDADLYIPALLEGFLGVQALDGGTNGKARRENYIGCEGRCVSGEWQARWSAQKTRRAGRSMISITGFYSQLDTINQRGQQPKGSESFGFLFAFP